MKKVIIPYQREEAIKLCDKHNKKTAAGNIWLTFGFGSKYDTQEMSIDLCDECADKLLKYLKTEFKDRAILINSNL
jgi:hypothetical protein